MGHLKLHLTEKQAASTCLADVLADVVPDLSSTAVAQEEVDQHTNA